MLTSSENVVFPSRLVGEVNRAQRGRDEGPGRIPFCLVPRAPADPRKAILHTAVKVLERRGYGAVTVREIAERAHVSSKTIYELFGNRDDLIVSAVEKW